MVVGSFRQEEKENVLHCKFSLTCKGTIRGHVSTIHRLLLKLLKIDMTTKNSRILMFGCHMSSSSKKAISP